MICENVQKKLPEFLNDLLLEEIRSDLRNHLNVCQNCQDHALRLGTFASDFMQMAQADLPFDLANAILMQLKTRRKHPELIRAGLLVLTLAVAFFVVRWYQAQPVKNIPTPLPAAQPTKPLNNNEQLETLQHLEAIKAELDKMAHKRPDIPGAVDIHLQPLHWHFKMESPESFRFLKGQLTKLNLSTLYDGGSFLVFEADKGKLEEVVNILKTSAGMDGKTTFINPSELPETETPIRVSAFFDVSGRRQEDPHWHFHFALNNSYVLAKGLNELGFKFILEKEEIWVLEITEDQYNTLVAESRQFPGLQWILSLGEFPQGAKLVQLSIFVE